MVARAVQERREEVSLSLAESEHESVLTLDGALQRLERALGTLEGVVQHRVEVDRSVSGLKEDIQRLSEDRSQLASTLDKAESKAARLEDANRDVSRRLVSAMESIRFVLDERGS